jgi:hypothetical protein
VAEKEKDGVLEVIDSYTTQIGVGVPEAAQDFRRLKISDRSIAFAQNFLKAASQA